MEIKIKELRNELGLSQKELAEKLNTSQKCVSNWENGINEPDLTTLIKIARLFDVSIDFLLGTEEDKGSLSYLSPLDKALFIKIKALPKEKKQALIELLNNI